MVSFVIPVYNGELYIERCVRSIIDNNCSEKKYEIIIVDDGSEDGTGRIVDNLSKIYSCVTAIHQSNAGVSAAREKGIDKALGDWIVFVDADDLISDDIVNIVSVWEKENVDWMVFSGHFLETEAISLDNPSTRNMFLTAILNQSENKILMDAHLNTVWSKAYKKELINKNLISFEKSISHGEDMLFNIDYFIKCSRICCISQYVYVLCANSNSATHKFQTYSIKNDFYFFEQLNRRNISDGENALKDAYTRMVLNGIWIILGQYFTHSSNKMKLKDKKTELAALLKQEPYKTGLKRCNLEKKSVRRFIFRMLNCHLYCLVLQGLKYLHKPNNIDGNCIKAI